MFSLYVPTDLLQNCVKSKQRHYMQNKCLFCNPLKPKKKHLLLGQPYYYFQIYFLLVTILVNLGH